MKRAGSWALVVIAAVVVVAGLGWQRWQATLLRISLEPLREETRDLERLRAENARLKQTRVPAVETARLRAEHETMTKLRAELETLRAKGGGR